MTNLIKINSLNMLLYSISIHLYLWSSIVGRSYNLKIKDMKSIIHSIFLDTILKSIECIYIFATHICIDYINRFHNIYRLLDESFMMKLNKLILYLRFFSYILFLPTQSIHLCIHQYYIKLFHHYHTFRN